MTPLELFAIVAFVGVGITMYPSIAPVTATFDEPPKLVKVMVEEGTVSVEKDEPSTIRAVVDDMHTVSAHQFDDATEKASLAESTALERDLFAVEAAVPRSASPLGIWGQ